MMEMVTKVWDIQQIIQQHNQQALDLIMQPDEIIKEHHPQPKVWALSMLAEMLMVGPPQLNEIVRALEGIKDVEKFVALVDLLLPEHKAEIMGVKRNRRVYQFCYHFGHKYYPLPANTDCSPEMWTQGIPVEIFGLSYTAYHDMNMRPGFMMLLALTVYPFQGDERDGEDDDIPYDPFDPMKAMKFQLDRMNYKPSAKDVKWLREMIKPLPIGGVWAAPAGFAVTKTADDAIKITKVLDKPEAKELVRRTIMVAEKAGITVKAPRTGKTAKQKMVGARMPFIDSIARIVGAEMAGKIPKSGWSPEELHKMTDGTIYDGVGIFADWALSQTGCIMMDSNYENCDYNEGDMEPIFQWTKRNVEILTSDYPKLNLIREKMDHIVGWLEEDQVSRFTGLLRLCIEKSPPEAYKRTNYKIDYDPVEHFIPLETVDTKEEDEIEENDITTARQ
jgi:hypothetical protein